MHRNRFFVIALFLSLLFLLHSRLSAAGFSILEQSTVGLGRALAGMTAEIDDPGALYFNPAAGAWHEQRSLMLGGHALLGEVEFHDRGSNRSGRQDKNITSLALVPNLYYVHPLSDGITLNVGLSATSGTSTKYRGNWPGRYFAHDTEIKVIELNSSLSWRLNDEWALGAAFIVQYADALMSQAIPFDTVNFNRSLDGQLKLQGDSYAFGYSLGIIYRPLPGTRVGLGYRSKLSHDLSAKARLRVPKLIAPFFGGKTRLTEDASIDLDLPPSINLGIQQELTEKLTLMFDVAWTKWSDMRELKVEFDRPLIPGVTSSSEVMKWQDNWRFALGGEYKLNEKWVLRSGLAFDRTPVRSKELRIAKLPDDHRLWLSFGAGYKIRENLQLDAAFTHLFFHKAQIRQEDALGSRLHGNYTGYMNIYSMAINYKF
ncbi:MAG: hypothetical protein GX946_05325 [Oligosphaeraceae bacterium]|nr:hypothetical protein [Oligosphaeraceae bacterium]